MRDMKRRARDIGIPFTGVPGPLNAITDVAGVEVGHTTLVRGNGKLCVGQGPVRTGVTAILPRGRSDPSMVFGASFALNGGGEMTGFQWLEESGFLQGPVMITNTHSVGVVRDATIQWMLKHGWDFDFAMPVVGETYDGRLNDINGNHVLSEHAWEALDGARAGPVAEGSVGGGTGMMCYEFKSGIGTSSRRLSAAEGAYTIGVLVQANYGFRRQLRIAGLLAGERMLGEMPYYSDPALRPPCAHYQLREAAANHQDESKPATRDGSIIIVVATDAPLLPHQLRRIARRPALAIGRLGGVATEASGDIFLAFSTANHAAGIARSGRNAHVPDTLHEASGLQRVEVLANWKLTSLFEAVINATEEAILNSMVSADSCIGVDGLVVPALPHEEVRRLLASHGLLADIAPL
jgi:D-aminopeptidase